jgi:hypothetical protein
MLTDVPVSSLGTWRADAADAAYVCCASREERCVGATRLMREYRCEASYILRVGDGAAVQTHHEELEELLGQAGPVATVHTEHDDPMPGVATLVRGISTAVTGSCDPVVTLDITSLTTRHALLLLYHLDRLGLWEGVRLVYSEPKDYALELDSPLTTGVRPVTPVPGFTSVTSPSRPLLLVLILGYDGDRAMATYQHVDPNELVLVVPRPAYWPEWDGRTEAMNQPILAQAGKTAVFYADARAPSDMTRCLEALLGHGGVYDLNEWNCRISPLGPKPQAVGLYRFWREHRHSMSVLYAPPLTHNTAYESTGVGRTWCLQEPTMAST